MKERRSISDAKLINLEEGLVSNGETSYVKRLVRTTNSCKQLVQCVKFLLYLELLLFVGWACYTVWQTYRAESMEVKVTDSIRDSESHTPFAQKLSHEETTVIPNDFLTKVESLLQTENALAKETLKRFDEQPGNDETATSFVKTTEEPDSETKKVEESDTKLEPSPLFETNVPELREVEMEKNLENNESEENNSDPSKSDETVFVWNFGFLPFPNTYNIKEQSPFSTGDGDESENTEISEKPFEIENYNKRSDSDEKIAALTDQILMSLILQEVLRESQILDASKEGTSPEVQDSMFNDQFAEIYGDGEPFATKSQTESGSEEWKDDFNVYDDIITTIINRSAPKDTNEKTFVDFSEQNQDSTMGIENDFINQNPLMDFGDNQAAASSLLNAMQEKGEMGRMLSLPAETFEDTQKHDFEADISSWIPRTDEVPDSSVLTGAELLWTRSLNKRSTPDVTMNEGLKNMRVEDVEGFDERLVPQLLKEQNQNNVMSRMEQKITETTNNRVSNKGTPVNNLIGNRRSASLLDNFIHEEENLLAQEIASVSGHEQQLMKNYLNNFFHKMEILAAHIDKLHERYVYLNQLNDDYISQEFPSDYLNE